MPLAHPTVQMPAPRIDVRRDEAGFSLPEILTIVAIIAVLFGISIIAFQAAATTIQGDSNMRILEGQFKLARDRAVAERRTVEVRLVAPNIIQVIRWEPQNDDTTLLSSATLENNTTFVSFAGVPDTPDSFGGGSVFEPGGGALMFSADGMFTNNAGNPVNTTVFIGQAGKKLTARALTVFGTTARIRTYRWNGSQWGD